MRLSPQPIDPWLPQVAETFAFSLDEEGHVVAPVQPDAAAGSAGGSAPAAAAAEQKGGGGKGGVLQPLSQLARLDTCVTVVDASNLLDNMESLQTLKVGCGCQCVSSVCFNTPSGAVSRGRQGLASMCATFCVRRVRSCRSGMARARWRLRTTATWPTLCWTRSSLPT